jgi:hypothetical protein
MKNRYSKFFLRSIGIKSVPKHGGCDPAKVRKVGFGRFIRSVFSRRSEKKDVVWDSVFKVIRQPDWWRGDSEYHPPAYTEPISDLERRLREGQFIVTAEIAPPVSANTDKLKQKIELVKPYVTALNFTDNSSAIPKMSGIACANVAYKTGSNLCYRSPPATGREPECSPK